QISAHCARFDIDVEAIDRVPDRGLNHVVDVVEQEAAGHGAFIDRIEPINLQHAGLPRTIGHGLHVLADKLNELSNRCLVDLRALVISPPSLWNRKWRYLCILSVGSRQYTVREATLSMKS